MSQTVKTKKVNPIIISPNSCRKYQIKSDESYNFYLVDVLNSNTNTNLTIDITKGGNCTLNIYALSDGFHKIIKLRINHNSYTTSNTIVKAFASNHSTIKLDLINIASPKTTKIVQNQSVDGILFDKNSSIDVTPSMLIDTNAIKASHAVNIGNINPNHLFYLMSRGLTKTKATMTILNGMFATLNEQEITQDLYNKATLFLKKIIKETNENKDKS
ncbi:MAG: SufD family Fe-S cluster assembly protein [Mycoplasmataceae bacterium]|jgi:Fe-S cluster assembly protein SufD|nr:SufD family Fe-S cluster assembly protein [Mycoplasmataceae bacterium]